MTTFTELVATVVVHSSAVALSHFGVTMEPTQAERLTPPPAERVIARTPIAQHKVMKLTSCPQARGPIHELRV
jgi:hypothetical protein